MIKKDTVMANLKRATKECGLYTDFAKGNKSDELDDEGMVLNLNRDAERLRDIILLRNFMKRINYLIEKIIKLK